MKKHIYHGVVLILQPIIFIPTLMLFKIFCKFNVLGIENIKDIKGKLIIAANHASEWDPILIRAALPLFSSLAPTYYVSAPKENFKTFGWKYFIYGGFFFEVYGAYSIHPGKNNYNHSLQNHLQILAKNRTLCIFPQGQRVAPGQNSKIHGGVAFLSFETKTSVIPLKIEGSYKLNFKDFFYKKRNVTLSFLPKLEYNEIVPLLNPTIEDFKTGAELIMSKISV